MVKMKKTSITVSAKFPDLTLMAFYEYFAPRQVFLKELLHFFPCKILFCNTGYWLSSARHVHGLPFKMIFTVSKPFSCSLQFRLIFPSTTLNDFFHDPINVSNWPPHQEALGNLNFHLVLKAQFCWKFLWIQFYFIQFLFCVIIGFN